MSRLSAVTAEAVAFYQHFGYVVLRGFLGSEEVARLGDEVRGSLAVAYADKIGACRALSSGFLLPMMGPLTPISRKLAVDPRLLSLGGTLVGESPGAVLIKPAKGICNIGVTEWHRDRRCRELRAVKVSAYLEQLDATNGALRVLPGSHHGTLHESMDELLGARQHLPTSAEECRAAVEERVPSVVLDVAPGDLIAFDIRLWHASSRGAHRHQWTVSYLRSPRTREGAKEARDYIGAFLSAGHQYDAALYPYYDPDWQANGNSPAGRTMRAVAPL